MADESKIEVLAPAGNMECLRAAVFAGADAVYMGGSLFSARAGAVNFTDTELLEAVKFARIRGVKVYVTVNTLIKDHEFDEVMKFVEFLCSVPVDGILVQDMGLFCAIRESAPDMPVHCSTQMSLHTPGGVKLMEELGSSRAVLAREMSLAEIQEVRAASGIELEAFVHGALCMSVSGQCYFSAMLGSRSGNRGRCAQTCRLPFENEYQDQNVLSLKDMSFIKNMDRLRRAGVMSAKIEGRMKRPEYVAAAVSACRKTADGEPVPEDLMGNLEAVFSRSGFTDGYLTGKRGASMFGIRTKEDVAAGTSAVFGKLHELYKNEAGRIPVDAKLRLVSGEKAVLELKDSSGRRVTASSEKNAEAAVNRPLDETRLRDMISKLGSTPYHLRDCAIETDGLSVLPVSALNSVRREAVEKLNEIRGMGKPVPFKKLRAKISGHQSGEFKFRGVFSSFEQVPENASALDMAYIPITEDISGFSRLMEKGIHVGAVMPRSFFGGEKEVREKMNLLMKAGIHTFLCGNLGAVSLAKEMGAVIHGGFSLNITNSESLIAFEKLGLTEAEVSFELTLKELEALKGNVSRGLMIYGRQPLMLVRNCPVGFGGCRNCGKTGFITDRRGVKFPVVCMKGKSYQSVEVLNSVTLSLCDRINEAKNADFGILRFTVENYVEIGQILEACFRQENPHKDCTRGLSYRGII